MFLGEGRSPTRWAIHQRHNPYFVPSYLEGTTYGHRLKEASTTQHAQREVQQPTATNGQTGQPPGSLHNKSSASHLGMKFDVIERAPPFEDEDTVAPLPSRLNKEDKYGGLEVFSDGQEIKSSARNMREHEYEISSIRADHPIPPQAGLYYFEVHMLQDSNALSRRRDEYVVSMRLEERVPQVIHWSCLY